MLMFLIKGLLRDKSRSLLPIIVVAAGAMLTVFLHSFIQGTIGDLLRTTARFESGHIKVTTRDYAKVADQLPNDLAIQNTRRLLAQLRKKYPEKNWVQRTRFQALLDVPNANGETATQAAALGMGVDLFGKDTPELNILDLKKHLIAGEMPSKPFEIVLGSALANKLKMKPGDRVTLIGSTALGSMVLQNLVLSGVVEFGIGQLDRKLLIADIGNVQEFLDMKNSAGEVLGFSPSMDFEASTAGRISATFNDRRPKEGGAVPVMRTLAEQDRIGGIAKLAGVIGGILVGVFVFAMSIVLWNAGLMSGIRRYGELGIRMAVGESKGRVFRSMLGESLVIGVVGSAIGTAIGLGIAFWFQHQGLNITDQMKGATVLISGVAKAQVTPASYYLGFIPGIFASVLGTIFAGRGIFKRQTADLFKEFEA